MQKSKNDVTAVIAYCCVRLQAKPKHIHKPKYCQPTREQSAAFNTVIAQYMQETTRRDIGVSLQAIQDAEKRCFTEVPATQTLHLSTHLEQDFDEKPGAWTKQLGHCCAA